MQKSILITGSTSGIGRLAALELARRGHRVWLHGRSQEKVDRVVAEVQALGAESVRGFVADFADLVAVRRMAEEVLAVGMDIDVLINNAGVFRSADSLSIQGFDLRFAVNYLAPFVLTRALLPLLRVGSGKRIINLSSAAQSPVSLEALAGREALSEDLGYAQSKLALTMWSMHLAAAEPDLVVIPVNPGSLLDTRMVQEGYGFHRSPAEKGMAILVDLAVGNGHAAHSGDYFDNDQGAYGPAHPYAYRAELVEALVGATEEVITP